jgi:hypothetical protein
MAKRIILKETDLSLGSNPPAGYKYLGFDDDTLSERTGATVSGIGSVSYKVYTALLSQSGTDAPTAVVLENTIGNIVWTRDSEGFYFGTLLGVFTENKTICFIGGTPFSNQNAHRELDRNDANSVFIYQSLQSNNAAVFDGFDNPVSIEIRVYN